MEMNPGVVRAWQMYFVSNGIKQPFIQIWEPVIDSTTIRRDRYKRLKIPGYRLMSQDKHGITVKYERHDRDTEKIVFSFSGCDASIKRLVEPSYITAQEQFGNQWIAYSSQRIDPQEFFEILDFSFRTYTRQVNHIVEPLDKRTIRDLIVKDDVSIVDRLASFTLAQIEEFLKLATDNSCMNVTAALLEFKNANFVGFDPMAECTLDF